MGTRKNNFCVSLAGLRLFRLLLPINVDLMFSELNSWGGGSFCRVGYEYNTCRRNRQATRVAISYQSNNVTYVVIQIIHYLQGQSLYEIKEIYCCDSSRGTHDKAFYGMNSESFSIWIV